MSHYAEAVIQPTVQYKNSHSNWENHLENVRSNVTSTLNDGNWKNADGDSVPIDWYCELSHADVSIPSQSTASGLLSEAKTNSTVQSILDNFYNKCIVVVDDADFDGGGEAYKIGSANTDEAVAVTFQGGDNVTTITHEIGHLAGARHEDCTHAGLPFPYIDDAETVMHNPNYNHMNCHGNEPHQEVFADWSNCEEYAIGEYMEGKI